MLGADKAPGTPRLSWRSRSPSARSLCPRAHSEPPEASRRVRRDLMALRLLPLASVEARRDSLLPFRSAPSPCSSTSRSLARFPPKELLRLRHRRRGHALVFVGSEETTEVQVSEQQQDASREDLEYVSQVKQVLELLKKNRDMVFGEVKLTMMIEDPRELERKRLLGIDLDEVTRDELVTALEDVHDGRIPENRVALRLLAEEMAQWPNLEVEATKTRPSKSLYARATDIGVDPKEAANRLNVDWDSAADIEPADKSDGVPVPPAVGYGALYLVTALPVLIGVSVVLILFYNSLQ